MAYLNQNGLERFYAGLKERMNGLSRDNLLDNWDFRCPVNQRGLASGTAVNSGLYFLDRWQREAGTLTWQQWSGLSVSAGASIRQYLEVYYAALCGTQVTFSLYNGSAVKAATLTFPSFADTQNSQTCASSASVPDCGSVFVGFLYCPEGVMIGTQTFTYLPYVKFMALNNLRIDSVKLEMGVYSTLNGSQTCDFPAEFLRCSRYFSQGRILAMPNAALHAMQTFVVDHSYLVPMRTKPVVNFSDVRLWPGWESAGTTPAEAAAQVYSPLNDVTGVRSVTLANAPSQPDQPLTLIYSASAEF